MSSPPPEELLSLSGVPVSLPLDINLIRPKVADGMALLALSHTQIEHRLYEVMHSETTAVGRTSGNFSIRRLLSLSGLRSYGSVKRGCAGLLLKRSIESVGISETRRSSQYRVFSPEEVFERRVAAGIPPYPDQVRGYENNQVFTDLIHHVVRRGDLSRREALVVFCCAEGMSNAEIGAKLQISEQTVKSHLRQVFDKFGVRRRTELVSRLLTLRPARRKKNGNTHNKVSSERARAKDTTS